MDSYEINKNTCAIISIDEEICKVIENNDEYFINKSTFDVMEESCQYYGSSFEGRVRGTKNILGSNYKVPIIIEESNELIFFPISSPVSFKCTWISLNNISKYERCNGFTKVTFNCGKEVILKLSISSFEGQLLRANRLGSIIKKRSSYL